MYKVRYVGYNGDNELVSSDLRDGIELVAIGIYDIKGDWFNDYFLYAEDIVRAVVLLYNNGVIDHSALNGMLYNFENNNYDRG
jgi:hypothetical protein